MANIQKKMMCPVLSIAPPNLPFIKAGMGIKNRTDRIENAITRIMGKGINHFDFGGLVVSSS